VVTGQPYPPTHFEHPSIAAAGKHPSRPESNGVSGLFSEIAADASPRGTEVGMWARRALLTLFAVVAALGLVNLFGQHTSEGTTSSAAATLRLTSPAAVRGGLFFQSRVEVRAAQAIDHPRFVLERGWLEGMQVNSIEPSPVGEGSRDGRLVLSYDGLKAGDRLVVWFQFEVNPTNIGHRSYAVELDDGETPIARVRRHMTVYP
jgi:hypothetical protein